VERHLDVMDGGKGKVNLAVLSVAVLSVVGRGVGLSAMDFWFVSAAVVLAIGVVIE
jgi:hypothetical protein